MFKGLTFKEGDTPLWWVQLEDDDSAGEPTEVEKKPFRQLVLRGATTAAHRFYKLLDQTVTVATGLTFFDDNGVPAVDFTSRRVIARDFVANGGPSPSSTSPTPFTAFTVRTETRDANNGITARHDKWSLKLADTSNDLELVSASTSKISVAQSDALLTVPSVSLCIILS